METQAMIATALWFVIGLLFVCMGLKARNERNKRKSTPSTTSAYAYHGITDQATSEHGDTPEKSNSEIKKKTLKAGDYPLLVGISLLLLGAYQLSFIVTFCLVIALTSVFALRVYNIVRGFKGKEFIGKKMVVKNKYQDLSSDAYSWLVFFLPQLAAFCGQAYTVWIGREAVHGGQDLILAIFGVFFVPMAFANSGLPTILSQKGLKGSKILSFWGTVIGEKEWRVKGNPKKLPKNPSDACFRCFADVFINFVYPTFLFMVFPIFVATSTSYMGAISTATGVLFAVQWDAESADIELKPAGSHEVSPPVKALGPAEIEFVRKLMATTPYSEQELNRGEALA